MNRAGSTPPHGPGAWVLSRAPRERLMLAVMAAAVVAFGLWLGLVRPMQAVAGDAKVRHEGAAAELIELRAALEELRALRTRQPIAPAGALFERALLDTAETAQVAIARRRTDGTGATIVGIDTVAAPALFGWLEQLRTAHGIAPESLEVTERNAALRVEAVFRPAAP